MPRLLTMNSLTASCCLAALVVAVEAGAAPAESVRVYDSTQLALDSYVVLRRLGVEDWRSAFRIPGYRDEASAREALLAAASRLRADGVINVYCLGQTDRVFNPAGYYCYGNAIKLRKELPSGALGR